MDSHLGILWARRRSETPRRPADHSYSALTLVPHLLSIVWRASLRSICAVGLIVRGWIRSGFGRDPFAGDVFVFGAAAASARHSAYSLRHSTVAYRWHPLTGQTLQVSPHRRGKDLTCIYTAERPGLCRELPNWMFDQAYCAGMTLGAPVALLTNFGPEC